MANGDDLGFVPTKKTDDLGFVPAKKAPPVPQATIGPDNRGLLQRANDWWLRKPAYEGTLDNPGRSPREKAGDVGTAATVASLPLLGAGLAAAPGATLLGLGGGVAGGYAGKEGGEWLGGKVGAPELGGDVGGLAGSLLGANAGAKSSRVLGNKAAALLRSPATARQSQLGRPGSVKEILPPQLQKWTLPPWLVPKGEVGTPTNPGPFSEIPARMPKPAAPESVPIRQSPYFDKSAYQAGLLGKPTPTPQAPIGDIPSEEGVPGTLPRPSGRMVKLPGEFDAVDQLLGFAKKRASERGMQFAAGMVPAEGRSVPRSPTPTNTMEFPGPRGNATPFAPQVNVETDSLGIRWAVSPDGYRVSIPRSVPDEGIAAYAAPKLAEQAQIHSSMRAKSF